MKKKLLTLLTLVFTIFTFSQNYVVVPNALENQTDVSTENGAYSFLIWLPSVRQYIINQSELNSMIGKEIIGISWRLDKTKHNTPQPTEQIIFENFDIYLGESVAPTDHNDDIQYNAIGNQTLVRSGGLIVEPNTYSAEGDPAIFGPLITFDTPYLYAGGNLLFELRSSGFDSSAVVRSDWTFLVDINGVLQHDSYAYHKFGDNVYQDPYNITKLPIELTNGGHSSMAVIRFAYCDVAIPTGQTNQTFTPGQTIADLAVNGTNLVWYSDEFFTDMLSDSDLLVAGTYYVVSQVGNCQSDPLIINVTETVNRSDFALLYGFNYYPNPTNDILHFSSNQPIENVIVSNMLGQQVNVSLSSDNKNLDLSNLANGNYFVKVTIEGVSKTIKIVKQ